LTDKTIFKTLCGLCFNCFNGNVDMGALNYDYASTVSMVM